MRPPPKPLQPTSDTAATIGNLDEDDDASLCQSTGLKWPKDSAGSGRRNAADYGTERVQNVSKTGGDSRRPRRIPVKRGAIVNR
jgi:hypothetical protein